MSQEWEMSEGNQENKINTYFADNPDFLNPYPSTPDQAIQYVLTNHYQGAGNPTVGTSTIKTTGFTLAFNQNASGEYSKEEKHMPEKSMTFLNSQTQATEEAS